MWFNSGANPVIHPEKKASSNWMPFVGVGKKLGLVAAVLPLVLGIAIHGTRAGTDRAADQRTGTRVARLMADDRTGTRA